MHVHAEHPLIVCLHSARGAASLALHTSPPYVHTAWLCIFTTSLHICTIMFVSLGRKSRTRSVGSALVTCLRRGRVRSCPQIFLSLQWDANRSWFKNSASAEDISGIDGAIQSYTPGWMTGCLLYSRSYAKYVWRGVFHSLLSLQKKLVGCGWGSSAPGQAWEAEFDPQNWWKRAGLDHVHLQSQHWEDGDRCILMVGCPASLAC